MTILAIMALRSRPMRQKYPKAVSVVHSSVTAALPSRSPTPQRILLWEAGLDRSTVLHNHSGALVRYERAQQTSRWTARSAS